MDCVGASKYAADKNQDQKALENHRVDSLNLLVFVMLLILTVLTIWFFKHHRLRFVHETGLSLIYGLIIGAIINYTMDKKQPPSLEYSVVYNTTTFSPPDVIILKLYAWSENTSMADNKSADDVYRYGYQSRIIDVDQSRSSGIDLESKATFDPELFFNIILPPIIFNAGYHMKRKHFFKNFGTIVTYAFVGTTISSFVTGGLMYAFCLMVNIDYMGFADCLLFGTIISATDPVTVLAIFSDLNVDVDLYALVFGESVLNDAVAIVLATSIENYDSSEAGFDGMAILKCFGYFTEVFFVSLLLGSTLGCVTALLTKFTRIQDFPLLETSLFVLMSYGTFVAAEAANQSGIVAVLFCGICQAHYTFNNLSVHSKARTKEAFELLNFLMENFVFTYIGVSTFTFQQHHFHPGFIAFSFLGIIVARASNIYPLTFLLNLGRSRRITWNFQHMLMYSGLRGAMAFALAMRNTSTLSHQTVLSTTLIIVIVTVILCGGFTTQVLQWLKIRVGVEDETELQNFDSLRSSDASTTVPASARLADKARLVRVWYNIDSRLFKPLLTHVRPPLTETLPKCCLPLARLLTTTEQLLETNGTGRVRGSRGDDSDTECVLDDVDDSISRDRASSLSGSDRMGRSESVGRDELLDTSDSITTAVISGADSNKNIATGQLIFLDGPETSET